MGPCPCSRGPPGHRGALARGGGQEEGDPQVTSGGAGGSRAARAELALPPAPQPMPTLSSKSTPSSRSRTPAKPALRLLARCGSAHSLAQGPWGPCGASSGRTLPFLSHSLIFYSPSPSQSYFSLRVNSLLLVLAEQTACTGRSAEDIILLLSLGRRKGGASWEGPELHSPNEAGEGRENSDSCGTALNPFSLGSCRKRGAIGHLLSPAPPKPL